jgi:hypothetical protein
MQNLRADRPACMVCVVVMASVTVTGTVTVTVTEDLFLQHTFVVCMYCMHMPTTFILPHLILTQLYLCPTNGTILSCFMPVSVHIHMCTANVRNNCTQQVYKQIPRF